MFITQWTLLNVMLIRIIGWFFLRPSNRRRLLRSGYR